MSYPRSIRTVPVLAALLALSCVLGTLPLTAAPAGASEGKEPIKVEGDVTHPQLIAETKAQPAYAEEARKCRMQAQVILQSTIDAEGNVVDVEVLEADLDPKRLKALRKMFAEEAMKAIHQWKFEPATLEGEPVSVYYNLTVNFRLE
ncbi:MAG: energy transducer TonB [bacterium]|nr:energy transducer TonB [bacterium]